MKFIKKGNQLTIFLKDGTALSNTISDEDYQLFLDGEMKEKELIKLLSPEYAATLDEIESKKSLLDKVKDSKILTLKGDSIYMESVSQFSIPTFFVDKIIEAEKSNNEKLLSAYKNFWLLCCLNPDSRVRSNLFWFLEKSGLIISKSGLFFSYRKALLSYEKSSRMIQIKENYNKIKKQKKSPKNYNEFGKLRNPDEVSLYKLYQYYKGVSAIYTDERTKTTEIIIGKPVSIPREDCDPVQENTCSRGLHLCDREYLKTNSFGNVTLLCLVNPMDVVAVPTQDSYKKFRTCRYFPVSTNVDEIDEDGYDDALLKYISYNGNVEGADNQYKIEIPTLPEINRSVIIENLNLNKLI